MRPLVQSQIAKLWTGTVIVATQAFKTTTQAEAESLLALKASTAMVPRIEISNSQAAKSIAKQVGTTVTN